MPSTPGWPEPTQWKQKFDELMEGGYIPRFVDIDQMTIEKVDVCPKGLHRTHCRGFEHWRTKVYLVYGVDYQCGVFKAFGVPENSH